MSTTWAAKRTPVKGKVVATRVCEICKEDYTPKWEEQRTCGGPCARRLAGRQLRGRGVPVGFARAIARRKAARKAEVERECQKRWPELSVREIEIFNYAVKLGYNRGYAKGFHSQRRKRKDAA